jgi:hypothetical protein
LKLKLQDPVSHLLKVLPIHKLIIIKANIQKKNYDRVSRNSFQKIFFTSKLQKMENLYKMSPYHWNSYIYKLRHPDKWIWYPQEIYIKVKSMMKILFQIQEIINCKKKCKEYKRLKTVSISIKQATRKAFLNSKHFQIMKE